MDSRGQSLAHVRARFGDWIAWAAATAVAEEVVDSGLNPAPLRFARQTEAASVVHDWPSSGLAEQPGGWVAVVDCAGAGLALRAVQFPLRSAPAAGPAARCSTRMEVG